MMIAMNMMVNNLSIKTENLKDEGQIASLLKTREFEGSGVRNLIIKTTNLKFKELDRRNLQYEYEEFF